MRTRVKIVAVGIAVAAIAGGTLIWAPGRPAKPTKCPWPPCTATCDPANQAPGFCLDKDGIEFESTFECCCCTPDAKHRTVRGPR